MTEKRHNAVFFVVYITGYLRIPYRKDKGKVKCPKPFCPGMQINVVVFATSFGNFQIIITFHTILKKIIFPAFIIEVLSEGLHVIVL